MLNKMELTARKRLLRVNNVVRRTGIPERTVRYFAAIGALPATRLGKKLWVFDPDLVDEFVRRRSYGR